MSGPYRRTDTLTNRLTHNAQGCTVKQISLEE
jgi:hypothetical protein